MTHNQESPKKNPNPRFTGIFIPALLLYIDELTCIEKMLLAWIDALYCKKRGGCYASNLHFSKTLGVKENTIAKSLTKLRKMYLIEDVSFDGRERVIRSKISAYQDYCESNAALDCNPMQGWIKIQCRVGQKSNSTLKPSYILERKDEIKEEKKPPPPSIPEIQSPKKEKIQDQKKTYGQHSNVKLTESEYKLLYEEIGEGAVGKLIASLDLYIGQTEKVYKSHYFTILNWNKKDCNPSTKKTSKQRSWEDEYKKDEWKPKNVIGDD